MLVRMNVNGTDHEAEVEWPGESLLHVLRETLGYWGAKNACEQGECGSCSVMLDDKLVCACLVPAAQAEGRRVVTIEALGSKSETGEASESLHPVQRAFHAAGAVQCGFCTPGFIMAVDELLSRSSNPDEAEIREALSGNLCRCTGYSKILDAVVGAIKEKRES